MTTKPKGKKSFVFTSLKDRKAAPVSPGMNEHTQRSSDRRVWDASPSLQKLDKFLGRKPPK